MEDLLGHERDMEDKKRYCGEVKEEIQREEERKKMTRTTVTKCRTFPGYEGKT